MSVFSICGRRPASCWFSLDDLLPEPLRLGLRARGTELQPVIAATGRRHRHSRDFAVATRVSGAAPASACVCVVQAVVTRRRFRLAGGCGGWQPALEPSSLDEPLTEPHQRERRLPLERLACGRLSLAWCSSEPGFAASALWPGSGGRGAGAAEAIVVARRTLWAHLRGEGAHGRGGLAPALPLLAISLSTCAVTVVLAG